MWKQEFVHNCDVQSIFGFSVGAFFLSILTIALLIGVGAMASDNEIDGAFGCFILAVFSAGAAALMWYALTICG